jgi:hypothetical protein
LFEVVVFGAATADGLSVSFCSSGSVTVSPFWYEDNVPQPEKPIKIKGTIKPTANRLHHLAIIETIPFSSFLRVVFVNQRRRMDGCKKSPSFCSSPI